MSEDFPFIKSEPNGATSGLIIKNTCADRYPFCASNHFLVNVTEYISCILSDLFCLSSRSGSFCTEQHVLEVEVQTCESPESRF